MPQYVADIMPNSQLYHLKRKLAGEQLGVDIDAIENSGHKPMAQTIATSDQGFRGFWFKMQKLIWLMIFGFKFKAEKNWEKNCHLIFDFFSILFGPKYSRGENKVTIFLFEAKNESFLSHFLD